MKKEEMEEERKKTKEEEDGKTMKRQAKREQEKQRLNGLPVLPPALILRPLSDYFTIPLFTTAQGQNSSFSVFNTATSNKVNCVPFGQRASEDVAGQVESSSDWSSDSEEDELTSSDSESSEEEDVGEEQPKGKEPKKKGKKLKDIEELGPDGIPIRKRGVKEEPDLKKIRKQDVKSKKRENKIPKSEKERQLLALDRIVVGSDGRERRVGRYCSVTRRGGT
ncbi:hypothetical protein BLNAU_12659 [Blattamonas nauphoetae]|uniref:Uncharacterized protein n=1 Tax=Blattamonas nauphoetae TaxID=2049346 RepID=A0ABQ9XLX3_9EUKA|nr:hypothetical protein BLNAU_12659 [Blattamonas nauphoetae]